MDRIQEAIAKKEWKVNPTITKWKELIMTCKEKGMNLVLVANSVTNAMAEYELTEMDALDLIMKIINK